MSDLKDDTPQEANKAILDRTSTYHIVPANIVPTSTTKVPDIINGGERGRRLGCFLSVAIIRDLNEHNDPIVLQSEFPQFLVDADSVEDLKQRVFEELQAVFDNAADVISGKVSIEDLQKEAEKLQEDLVEQAAPEEAPAS